MKGSRLIKKTEKALLSEYLEGADFTEPPAGFVILSEKTWRALRLVDWKSRKVVHKSFAFNALSSGYNYIALACYLKHKNTGKLELVSIDGLYRNGKRKNNEGNFQQAL